MEQILPQSRLADWLAWLLRRQRLMRVTGRSMVPLLQPGDLLFVEPLSDQIAIEENDVVVAIHPQQRGLKIIKRVNSILMEERYFLLSDNQSEGTDSRVFGAVPRSSLIGLVTSYAIKMAERSEP